MPHRIIMTNTGDYTGVKAGEFTPADLGDGQHGWNSIRSVIQGNYGGVVCDFVPSDRITPTIYSTQTANLLYYSVLQGDANNYIASNHAAYSGIQWVFNGVGPYGTRMAEMLPENSPTITMPASFLSAFNGIEGTILFWLAVNDWTSQAGTQTPFTLWVDASNYIRLNMSDGVGNRAQLLYVSGGTTKEIVLSNQSSTELRQIALTWSFGDDELKIYIDGTQVGNTQTGLGVWVGTPSYCYFGKAGGGNYVNGFMSRLAVWSKPLTLSEIQAIKEAAL